MADLISRAAAIAEIEEYIEEYSELEPETGYHNLKWCAMEEAKDVLSMLPSVDAVPVVHARWVERMYKTGNITTISYFCSKCDGEHYFGRANYCPNCGAKMNEMEETQ